MADIDLLFRQAPLTQPADLIFGEVENFPDVEITLAATLPALTVSMSMIPPADVTVDATLPGLTVAVAVATFVDTTLAATLPGLTVTVAAVYRSEASRPTVGKVASAWETATSLKLDIEHKQQNTQRTRTTERVRWQQAQKTPAGIEARHQDGTRLRSGASAHHQEAVRAAASVSAGYTNMLRTIRPVVEALYQTAEHLGTQRKTSWQERYRDRRPSLLSSWGESQQLLNQLAEGFASAIPSRKAWGSRYQEAVVPPPGVHLPPLPPTPGEPCYTPSTSLLFVTPWSSDSNLVFICEKHVTPPGSTVVVPVRRVYIVINNATLKRVDGDVQLPTYSMSMSLDVDSWTWGFNASVPANLLDVLMPDEDGTPVELEASINGVPYRLMAEKLSRERAFGNAAIRVTGQGKNTMLGAPYAPIQSFSNSIDRTAQQLMGDALTFNGISIGWDVDWNIDDWLVPAGVWNKQGSYIDALSAIAGAAGAYLQPHATDQVMRVLARYPSAPWEWGDVTPDFELPADVTTKESIEWRNKPVYNRVFVSGTSAGVLGQVTRAGTAGDLVAPMVTDALITQAVAARQRGIAVLSDTGRQALVNLKLPVLAETGVITPGKFVRYVDGSDIKLGIVRSTGVEATYPEVWQSLTVETHVGA